MSKYSNLFKSTYRRNNGKVPVTTSGSGTFLTESVSASSGDFKKFGFETNDSMNYTLDPSLGDGDGTIVEPDSPTFPLRGDGSPRIVCIKVGETNEGKFQAGLILEELAKTPEETVYLFQSNSYNGDSTIVDSMGNGVVSNSGMTHSTEQAKFGTSSFKCNGSAAFYVAPSSIATLGTGDGSIDFWVYRYGTIGYYERGGFVSQGVRSSTLYGLSTLGADTNSITMGILQSTVEVGSKNTTTTESLAAGTWVHVAVVRHSGYLYTYLNGQLQSSDYQPVNLNSGALAVGRRAYNSSLDSADQVYLDEIRLIKGKAVWQNGENFTPPEEPYIV